MNILICNPGLSFQADATFMTRLRAQAIQKAGITVTVMGYPASFADEYARHGLSYIGVETMLNPSPQTSPWPSSLAGTSSDRAQADRPPGAEKSGKQRAVWQKRMGNYWTFIAEPAIVIWQALRYASAHAVDLIYMSNLEPWLMLLLWWLFPQRSKPHVVAVIPLAFRRDPNSMPGLSFPTKLRWALNTWACRVLPRYIHLVCDNRHVPAVMGIDKWPTVYVIPEGHRDLTPVTNTLAARQRLGIPSNCRMLLMFGVASFVKGADLLLQALEDIPPTFNVYIVGQTGGVYRSDWGNPERLYQKGWKDHLFIVPRHVSNEEMDDYFSACDALILPYRGGYETTSGNLRLAIEHGKAILASDQYCLGETVRNYQLGLLFPPGDVAALRTCLLNFAEQPTAWFETIRAQGAVMNHELAWEEVAKQYVEVFNKILHADR